MFKCLVFQKSINQDYHLDKTIKGLDQEEVLGGFTTANVQERSCLEANISCE